MNYIGLNSDDPSELSMAALNWSLIEVCFLTEPPLALYVLPSLSVEFSSSYITLRLLLEADFVSLLLNERRSFFEMLS